ncbi:MAG: YiiX/YebB-like N1pC/P60 family cysteine hydrolase [Bdellovibrionales bacterium]
MKILLAFYMIIVPILASADDCGKVQTMMSEGRVISLFTQEAVRFFRIQTGFYQKWTGPEDERLKAVCQKASDAAEVAGEGAVIFIGLDSKLYSLLSESTNSWVSHTGLLFRTNDSWGVIESRAPKGSSRLTPLCAFVRRSADYRFAIAQVREQLNPGQLKSLKASALEEAEKFYDFSFNLNDSHRSFCSKLTYQAYRAIGIDLGHPHSLARLLAQYKGPESRRRDLSCFWRAWMLNTRLIRGRLRAETDFQHLTITPGDQYDLAREGLDDSSIPFFLTFEM